MSSNAEEVQSGAMLEIKARAEEIRQERLQAAGLSEQYDLWRESMPDTRMPDNEAYNLFMSSQIGEEEATSGALSVSTGGTELVTDTDIPTPGPGDEETRPGEDGEASKGGGGGGDLSRLITGEDPTALKLVEGMWTPPEEAEAENYEEPSTYDMTQSADFIKEARVLYDYMKPEGEKHPTPSGFLGMGSLAEMRGEAPKQLSDSEIGEWGRNIMSGFNWNVVNTMAMAHRIMTSDDPDLALAFLNMINMYDHSDGGTMDFAGALQEIATDPTTYLGLGVGSVVAKGAAKTVAKTGLKKAMQMAIVGSTAGGIEGGMLAGGFDLAKQNIEQEAGARKDIDYTRAGIATGLGVGLGVLLGGSLGGFAGRRMDKFAALVKEEKKITLARDVFLDESSMKELGHKELTEMLETLVTHEGKAEGGSDLAVRMANAILDETGSMPRLKDGSVDYKKIYKIIDEISEADVARQSGKTIRSDGNEVRMADDIEDPTRQAEVESLANELDIEIHDILGEEGDIIYKFADDQDAKRFAEAWLEREGSTAAKIRLLELSDAMEQSEKGWFYESDRDVMSFYDPVHDESGYKAMQELAEEMDLGFEIGGRGGADAFVIEGTAAQKLEFTIAWNKKQGIPSPEMIGRRQGDAGASNEPFRPDIADEESQKLTQKILEMEELEKGDVVLRTTSRPGSIIRDELGETLEVVGRTKNGWYRVRDNLGRERSLRRKQFEVTDKAPAPRKAGPMELDPFSNTAAKIIAMNEEALSGKLKLREITITHKEQQALADEMAKVGIDITKKPINAYWTPAELLFLRNTYDHQAKGMADLAIRLEAKLLNEGRLLDSDLAGFNNAHSVFVATRDLFYGTSGNAARQLNILRSRPTEGVYNFNQSLLDSISIQGGRANTERAIKLMSEFSKTPQGKKNPNKKITNLSESIWGSPKAALLLNVRYNMMLSSWRTHAFNFIGNSASGVYQHLMISPVRMGINNLNHMNMVALGILDPKFTPDPADRMTLHNYYAELRGHFAGARDSLMLAKEIAMGRDIGEGKVWNELGLRYNVINVPDTAFGKLGTTPVRLLEAGDAFFKNQYYNSKMNEFASIRARYDEVHNGQDFQKRFHHYLENPDELGGSVERAAKDFAAKQTYTNDPNVYGGLLAAVAKGVSSAQNKSLMVNMIIPFVRTPANLLSYSMEMIGANTLLSPAKTFNTLMKGTQREQQESLARLTIAAGLWLMVQEAHQNGQITGTGPSNWEERQVWMAAGWQPNSIMVHGKWYSMERAAPAGMSLATMASVFDYYAMTQQQDKPAMEWIGAGLLYTADMILDESYLSSATDVLTAISSKETGRFQSAGASMLNSVFVPNFLRDLRRPADEAQRSVTGVNLLDAMHKQMMNASPWHSGDLPPKRDWKGDIVNYYGNAYHRALVPFNVRNPEDSDPASMALAYSRIPVSTPSKTMQWPGGLGDAIDLFAMDDGQGYVYDEYKRIMGKQRENAINILLETQIWATLVEEGEIGPGTEGNMALLMALGFGSKFGRLEMLDFLIDHSGDNNTYKRKNTEGKDVSYLIQHPVSVEVYIELQRMVREQRVSVPEDQKQYIIKKPVEGPEFFKP